MTAESAPRGLARLQAELQRAILAGGNTFDGAGVDPKADTTTRLAIYSNAYRLRLIEALAANFPAVRRSVGEEGFARTARAYLAAFPSQNPSVRWFGHRFPQFLRANMREWVADLALLEWDISGAFDAEDATPVDLSALAIAPAEWPWLRFELHPSVRMLRLQTNAVEIFSSLSADEHPPEPRQLGRQQGYVIWRRELDIRFREQSDDEADALATLSANGTFEMMCARLSDWRVESEVPIRAASLLKTWVLEGMIAKVIARAAERVPEEAGAGATFRA